MPKFEVPILPIDKVENHPEADRLSLNHIRGYVLVSNKLEDGSHRYSPGQLMAYVPENSVVPVAVLQRFGYWDNEKNKGLLGGPAGDIVQPFVLRRVTSHGVILPTESIICSPGSYMTNGHGDKRLVHAGHDVSSFLGITKHEYPLLPSYSASQLIPRIDYEVEDLRKYPDLLKGRKVVVTEMLHGVLCIIGFDRTLDDPFFVASATSAPKALVVDKAHSNIYTQTAEPIWEEIKRYLVEMPAVEKFYLFGVIIGPGIQDLTYGLQSTEFRAIDVQMGVMGGGPDSIPFGFIGTRKYELFKWLNIATVPIVMAGDYDYDAIYQLANAPSTIGGGQRRGVVITAEDEGLVNGMRPILRLLSDKFLIRKKGTNFK